MSRVCVEGRGRSEYMSRANKTEAAIPVFAWDYGYMKRSDSVMVTPDGVEDEAEG